MMNLISNYRRNKALKDYFSNLGISLNKRYGNQEQFTVMQIEKTVNSLGLDKRFMGYAIAMYRHESSENTVGLYSINQELLDLLRVDIGNWFMGGNSTYTAQEVIRLAKPQGWHGGSPNKWVASQARIGAYHR